MKNNCMEEVWPFNEATSGSPIHETRFYGFADSGSLYGSHEGYETSAIALVELMKVVPPFLDISTEPSLLGDSACCLLSGRQFIDQLKVLLTGDQPLSDHGTWSIPFFFTFCMDHTLSDSFAVINAKDHSAARAIMVAAHGTMWAFQYDESRFAGQPEKYNLTEVPLGTKNQRIIYQD